MIETIFAASFVASVAVLLFLRLADVPERRRLLFRGLLELTIPLMLTSGIFAGLQWWVRSLETGVTATTSIREIELAIRTIRNGYIERLVLPAWVQFLVLCVLMLTAAIWPKVRKARLRDGFRATTRWMTRIQIAATLLASFTFFGAVQATNARNAEVRLGEDISSIERTYDGAFAGADEAVASAAVAELLSDPAWTPAFAQLSEALAAQQNADDEIAAARAAIAREPDWTLRDFRMAVDEVRPAVEKVHFPERVRPATRMSRETWSRAQGEHLAADAEVLRRDVTTELVNAAADVGREAIARRLVAEFFAGSVAEGFAAVVLDASVLYDFRHVVADTTASLIERVLQRRENLRTAFSVVLPRLRNGAARLALEGARTAESIYAERARATREQLGMTQRVRQNTLEEFRIAADAQAARERKALIERVTEKLDGNLELATRLLLNRLIGGAEERAMTRIARIRSLDRELRVPRTVPATLAHKERELGGSTVYNDMLDMRIERLLRTERYETPWAKTLVFDDFETTAAWEKERRAFVLAKIGEGAATIEPHEWERARTFSRSTYLHGPTGTGTGKARQKPRRPPVRRGR